MARKSFRAHGAIFTNPKRKRVRGSALAKALGVRKRNGAKRRKNATGTRRRVSARRNATRRRVMRSSGRARVARRNPRKRRSRKAAPRSFYKRNGAKRSVRRRSARSSFRNRRRSARRNGAESFAKVPVIGGLLASLYSFTPAAIAGALSVEPGLAVAQLLARYFPALPSAILYPIAGMTVAVAFEQFAPIKDDKLRRELAIAMAAGGAAVGYYKKRTGQDKPAAVEMGALVYNGMGSPIANAIQGQRGMGALVYSGQHYAGLQYASPAAVVRY
jgi:hypothetical protein